MSELTPSAAAPAWPHARQLDATFEELYQESSARAQRKFSRRERLAALVLGTGFLAAAATMAAVLPWERSVSPAAILFFLVVYAAVSRVEFEVGRGLAVPTQFVFVPMLFALPRPLVPLVVLGALLLGDLVDVARRAKHAERVLLAPSLAWYSIGPALVLSLFASPEPTASDWPVYLAALAAQFGAEALASIVDHAIAFSVGPRSLLPLLAWSGTVDALLAPVGLAAAGSWSRMLLLTLPLGGLLAFLAVARRRSLQRALDLVAAYRQAHLEARRDALTGLANRLAWEEAVGAAEPGVPYAVVMLDLDGLKQANDTLGHHVGDELLRALAAAVHGAVRAEDTVARIGGDEIGVLVPGAAAGDGERAAGRIARAIAVHGGVEGFVLSAAIGQAACRSGDRLGEALREADARLYECKRRRGVAAA